MAALLRERLDLHGRPRSPEKPGYFSNYGLSLEDDAKLTAWMRKYLQLSTWAPEKPMELRPVESQLIIRWQPPLNLTDVVTEWTADIKSQRKILADEARRWEP